MPHTLSRRAFLGRTALAGAGLGAALTPLARAIEPITRSGPPKLMPSLAAYAFRDYFKEGRGAGTKTGEGRTMEMLQFIDYCAAQGCAAEVTSYYFPKGFDRDYLLRLKRHAFHRGVPLSGTAVGNTFTHPAGTRRDEEIRYVKEWVDHAAGLGAPHIRVFAGEQQRGTTKDEAKKLCIGALEECAEYAGSKGVTLGLENHGGIVAEAADLIDIVRAVKSPWCGLNFDSGNFHTADPYQDLALIAPYAVNVQWKSEILPRGAKAKQPSDLRRIVRILRDANYQGYVALEYEAEESPWTAVPRLLKEMRDILAG